MFTSVSIVIAMLCELMVVASVVLVHVSFPHVVFCDKILEIMVFQVGTSTGHTGLSEVLRMWDIFRERLSK